MTSTGGDGGVLDGQGLLAALTGGAGWLQTNKAAVDALNVYPVPDGDTGTNMLLTIQTALRDAQENPGDGTVGAMAAVIGQGALRGARGNSGVILSQYLKGFAQGLEGVGTMDGPALAKGLQAASAAAYGAMSKPVEGTMLTVGREAGEAAGASGSSDVIETLRVAADESQRSVERTPELLPVLASAGVVDSGGQGIAVILRGALSAVTGEDPGPPIETPTISFIDPSMYGDQDSGAWGYCTEFVLMEPIDDGQHPGDDGAVWGVGVNRRGRRACAGSPAYIGAGDRADGGRGDGAAGAGIDPRHGSAASAVPGGAWRGR